MPWVAPTSPTAGSAATATWADGVASDLTVLETQVGLYGYSGALFGSLPATGTPGFHIQCGTLAVTFTAGFSPNISFPVAFASGVITLQAIPFDSGAVSNIVLNVTGCGLGLFSLGAEQAGAAYTGSQFVSWLAIGS